MFKRLSVKFLLALSAGFLLSAVVAFSMISHHEMQKESEALEQRIGAEAALLASALTRHDAQNRPSLAQDLLAPLSLERAVLCAEIRQAGREQVLAAQPPAVGCRDVSSGQHLIAAIGADKRANLLVIFSDAEIRATSQRHRLLLLTIAAVGLAASSLLTLLIFNRMVGRPLARLHGSIQRALETGERTPLEGLPQDEFGDIAVAFNKLLEREAQREHRPEEVNYEIKELNRSLEKRVSQRTKELAVSEARLRHLIDSFSSGIYIHARFKPIYANHTLLDILGFEDLDDFLSIGSTETLLAPEERERIWGYHQARLKGEEAPESYDFWALTKNNLKFYVNNRSFAVDWGGNLPFVRLCST